MAIRLPTGPQRDWRRINLLNVGAVCGTVPACLQGQNSVYGRGQWTPLPAIDMRLFPSGL